MFRKIKIKVENVDSENDKALIETEIDILKGVKSVDVDKKAREVLVEFNDRKISQNKLFETLGGLGFQVLEQTKEELPVLGEHTYFVKGMHCASCEVLIEKRLSALREVRSVEVSASQGKAFIVYKGKKPSINKLNKFFRKENYFFFDQPAPKAKEKKTDFFIIAGTALLIIIGFFLVKNSRLAGLISVNSSSSLPMFFLLGVLAGISSCAALVGGLVLSMSKQWLKLYSEKKSILEKLQPHLMFNIGRLASYTILGGVIGIVGSKFQISLTLTSILIVVVSIMMVFLALPMMGVKIFRKFQFIMPKFITRYIADETKFQGKQMPFLMGALTFFLPCGFTITAQGLALISGSAIQGGLIMLFFALGTLPALLTIGLSSIKFFQKPHLANKFLRIAGILVLFFAFYNVNAQLNVLGFSSFSDIGGARSNGNLEAEEGLAPVVDGKQVLKMAALAYGYSPNYFKVKVGLPIRWEITDQGTSGCTNAIISRGLFEGEIPLTPGQTSIKEFVPTKAGKYKFSCWMGMVSGVIEVIGETNGTVSQNSPQGDSEKIFIPSGTEDSGGSCGGG
jgi:uncharacterized protein